MITYRAAAISDIDPETMRDMGNVKPFAVIRFSETSGDKIWGFHTSLRSAEQACRRWRSRDIVTR